MGRRVDGQRMRNRKWIQYLPIRRTKLRTYLVVGGVLIGLFDLNHFDLLPFGVGVVFMAIAAWIHTWSKGHLQVNAELTRSGPYRWVRDPFHFSNFIMDLGLLLIINNWVYTVIMMIFWVIAYRHRLGEEDEMLTEIFGDAYREYRAKVPRMIPYKPPMDKKYDKPFSLHLGQLYRGRVCTRLFRFSSYPYLLLVAAWAGDHGRALLELDEHAPFYWALCGFLFFTWLSQVASKLMTKRQTVLPMGLHRQPLPTLFAVAFLLALGWMEKLSLDSTALELHLDRMEIATTLTVLVITLALLCPPGLWRSYRFHRLTEGIALSAICLFTPLPWLALVPACYFTALFLYGHPDQEEADVDHVFPQQGADTRVMADPRYIGLLLIFYGALTPLLVH